MKKLATGIAAIALAFGGQASGQQSQAGSTAPIVQPAPTTATIAPAKSDNTIHVGTPILLKLLETITTKEKQARVGQRFNLEVAEAVQIGGKVVIPVGTPAVGEITEVRNKGMWGKSGHLTAQLRYLRAGDRQIRLSGTFDEKGTTGTVGVVAAIAFVPIAGFLTTGTSAKLPTGMPVKGFFDEDVPVVIGSDTPAAPLAAAPSK